MGQQLEDNKWSSNITLKKNSKKNRWNNVKLSIKYKYESVKLLLMCLENLSSYFPKLYYMDCECS